jgi:hypothetical protein
VLPFFPHFVDIFSVKEECELLADRKDDRLFVSDRLKKGQFERNFVTGGRFHPLL